VFASVFATACLIGCSQKLASDTNSGAQPIQVGWMTSWATTGQIMQALIHTNISRLYGVPLVFRSFLFGPDINEAALHGEVDCNNSGLVPTISLLSASPDWIVVGRLVDSPLSIVARNGSNINKVEDLKGKSVAVPFGGGTHPYVIQRLADAGLEIGEGKDKVKLVNLKPSEQAIAMQQGSVDAAGTWEPQTAIILSRNLGMVIDEHRHLGLITVRRSIARKQPEKIVRLLKAYIEANFYVARHRDETDRWFAEAAHFDQTLLQSIKVIEPNVKAAAIGDIKIELTPADLALAQRFADTMQKAELIPDSINFQERTDQSFLHTALKELETEGYQTGKVSSLSFHETK
jgi:ABC-type nitrate/sulfonate/bicarbonate transport system substrate-binding protein